MDDNFPVPLTNERDLDLYEKYINNADSGFKKSLPQYLSCHIGKPVRVETVILNRMDTKAGILLDVGRDYLVLKLPECQSMIIEGSCIKFITVIHNGNYRKYCK